MKKIIYGLLTAIILTSVSSCEKDNIWGDGLPEYEHVYYVGFYKSIKFDYYVTFEIAANGATQWREGSSTTNGTWEALDENNAVNVPLEFHSERVRSYDAVSKLWVSSATLVAGTDYSLSLEDGSSLTSESAGVYSLTWKQAKKGIQKVKVKRLTANTGDIKFYTLDPSKPVNSNDLTTLVNNKTSEYEIDALSADFAVNATAGYAVTNSKMLVSFK
ncbi:MAG: hypothetical protein LBR64_09690 [Dysgonamonadaceae bacterium]|jgi:hypothetical protein|nr:hypothetical protein [Dysgonamonadaceae bacterium]